MQDRQNRSHGGDEGDRQNDSRDRRYANAGDNYPGDTRYERHSERRDVGGYRHAPGSYRGSEGREEGAGYYKDESPRRTQHRSRSPPKKEPYVGALRREYQEAAAAKRSAEQQQREDDSGKRQRPDYDDHE